MAALSGYWLRRGTPTRSLDLVGINYSDAASLAQAAPLPSCYHGVAGYQRALALANLQEFTVTRLSGNRRRLPRYQRSAGHAQTITYGSVFLDELAEHNCNVVKTDTAFRLDIQTCCICARLTWYDSKEIFSHEMVMGDYSVGYDTDFCIAICSTAERSVGQSRKPLRS